MYILYIALYIVYFGWDDDKEAARADKSYYLYRILKKATCILIPAFLIPILCHKITVFRKSKRN